MNGVVAGAPATRIWVRLVIAITRLRALGWIGLLYRVAQAAADLEALAAAPRREMEQFRV